MREPEKWRAALKKKLAARAQEFAGAVASPAHASVIARCKVPGAVTQQEISRDAVDVSWAAHCRLGASRPK